MSAVVEVEPAGLLLEVWRETEARAEPFALNCSEDGAVGGWETVVREARPGPWI